MNKNQFLKKLSKLLKSLPPEEREAALNYYQEYFDEAGPENEQRIISELGSPEKVAAEVLAGSTQSGTAATTAPKKGGIGVIWTVILSILAAPIALPLAIASICIVTALAAALIGIFIAFLAVFFLMIWVGISALIGFPAFFFGSFGMSCISIGAFLLILAIHLVLIALILWLIQLIFIGIAKLFNKSGRKNKHE